MSPIYVLKRATAIFYHIDAKKKTKLNKLKNIISGAEFCLKFYTLHVIICDAIHFYDFEIYNVFNEERSKHENN